MKVVINKCYGGFSLSAKAVKRYAELSGFEVFPYGNPRGSDYSFDVHKRLTWEEAEEAFIVYWIKEDLGETCGKEINDATWLHDRDIDRHDPILVQVVEELGDKSSGSCAKLKIVEIPDGTDYEIDDYDGMERIAEKHNTWG